MQCQSLKSFAVVALFAAASFGFAAGSAQASPIVIDFDSVDTSGGTVVGGPVLTYLAGYGISFSTGYAINAVVEPYPGFVMPVSMPNMFGPQGSASFFSYTLSFSSLMDSVSFTRPGLSATIMSAWSATAYSASNVFLSAVGEGLLFSPPQASFNLTGPGIAYIVFTDNAFNFAGINFRLDNLTLTPAAVPEAPALALVAAALVFLLGLGLSTARRHQPI